MRAVPMVASDPDAADIRSNTTVNGYIRAKVVLEIGMEFSGIRYGDFFTRDDGTVMNLVDDALDKKTYNSTIVKDVLGFEIEDIEEDEG